MERLLFVSYFYEKGMQQGWSCIIVNAGNIVTSEDVDVLANKIKEITKVDHIVIINFRRLESPE